MVYLYQLNVNSEYTLLQTISGTTVQLTVPTNTNGVEYFDRLTLNGGRGFKENQTDLITQYVESLETVSSNGSGLIVDATVDAVGTITHIHIREAGNNYKVGDSVTIVNPLGDGAVTGFDLNLLSQEDFTGSSNLEITDVVSTTGSGSTLAVQIASTKTAGANIGDLIIPVPSVDYYKVGGKVFSNVSNVFGKVYSLVPGTNLTGTGTGAKFDITASDSGYLVSVALVNEGNGSLRVKGSNYQALNKIRILGTQLGGTSPAHDAVITVGTIDGTGGIVTATITGASTYLPTITETSSVTFDGTVEGTTLTVSAITGGNDDIVADMIAEISGTTLTIYEIAGDQIIVGMALTGTGVTANTTIVSGSGNTWTISTAQNISRSNLKAVYLAS
jgi:hypothetical protein